VTTIWDTIADEASIESPLWEEALLPAEERPLEPVFSPLGEERFALGLETIYEGYLLHFGRPRLFSPSANDNALLLGDYLYAHGLVRVAEAGSVPAVSVLAGLIARCAALRADGAQGDAEAWVDAARALGGSPSEDEVASALALHFARVAA
jgi:hypothetical protein